MLSDRAYGLLVQIRTAILQLKDWNGNIISSDDYYSSPDGMKNLAASCSLLKLLEKVSNRLIRLQTEDCWSIVLRFHGKMLSASVII